MAGRKATCPACQQRIVVPATVAESELKPTSVPKLAKEVKPVFQERSATSQSSPASVIQEHRAENNVEADTSASSEARTSSDRVAPVRSVLQKSWNVNTARSLKAAGWAKRLAILITQRALSIAARVRDETVGSIQCYRAHREAFWKQLLSGPIRLWQGEGSLAQDVEFFIPERERIETSWMVDLPNRCVACGIETNQPKRQQVCTLESFARTCRAIWSALAIAIVLLWWQPSIGSVRLGWWLTPLFFAVATFVAFRMRRQESATVRFCCCSEHAQNDRYPQLFLVSGGLLVRVGTAKASRWMQSERQDHDRQRRAIDSDDSLPLPVPIPPSLEGTEFYSPSMPEAARTMALVEDVEPTPIVHAVSTLKSGTSVTSVGDALDSGSIRPEEMPIEDPVPIVASCVSDSPSIVPPPDAVTPVPTVSDMLASELQPSLGDSPKNVCTTASPIDDDIMDGILVEENDSEGSSLPRFAELAADTKTEFFADTKTTSANGRRKSRTDSSRNSTNRSPYKVFAIKAAVVVTFTGILIAFVVPNVPSWMSQLLNQFARLHVPPPFEPWTTAQEAAVHQLEAKGAKVSRSPKMVTSRHYVEIVSQDSRTDKVTRSAFAEIHIDLESSSVADEDIKAIVQLKGDSFRQELKRVIVRGSKLSQDGIVQLRNELPNTVLEE